MRHRTHRNRLSQKPDQARRILRNLLTSVILYENVRTTKKRAQVVRPLVDKVITIAKKDRTDLAIRRINSLVSDENATRKALEVFKPRYADRTSGFTRMVPVGMRKGDGAALVDISFLPGKDVEPPAPKPKKARAGKAAAPVSPAPEAKEATAEAPKAAKPTKANPAKKTSAPSDSSASSAK